MTMLKEGDKTKSADFVNPLKEGDWVEFDFVGRVKSSNQIFDLSLVDVAKKEKVFDGKRAYKPLVVCLGKGQLIKGIDEALIGKEIGKEFEFDIAPEKGFGQKNPSLIQLTTLKIFKEKNFMPVVGMQVSIDNVLATVRSVTGGRVVLDFNHPLAGKILHYWVKAIRVVEKADEKVQAAVSLMTGEDVEVKSDEKALTLKTKGKLTDEAINKIKENVIALVKEIAQKELKFEQQQPEKK